MRYVVIGAGVAGMSAVEAIRSVDGTGEVYLTADDPHAYYSRPGLAYLLTGELPEKQLFPFSNQDFKRLGLRYLRARVTRIEPAARQVLFADGTGLGFDRLLLATGAQAVPLSIPGAGLEGVVKLDHLEDARRIMRLARRARTAVVIGGGITALELAEGLARQRVSVHYFLRADRYWGNVLDEEESRLIEKRLVEHGLRLHFHTEAAEILGRRGRVAGVRMADGRTLGCELVACAIGVQPRLELARQAGLDCDRGVLVDESLRTSAEDIYAAGDVAQVYDPLAGRAILDSLWGPARQQGRVAGLNMAGQTARYQKPPAFNVTRLAGLTTTIIGAVGRGRDEDLAGIARGDSETWRSLPDAIIAQTGFDVNRLRLMVGRTTILGAVVMGDQKLSGPLQAIVRERVDISAIRERLLAPEAPIADLLANFWAGFRLREAGTIHREL